MLVSGLSSFKNNELLSQLLQMDFDVEENASRRVKDHPHSMAFQWHSCFLVTFVVRLM